MIYCSSAHVTSPVWQPKSYVNGIGGATRLLVSIPSFYMNWLGYPWYIVFGGEPVVNCRVLWHAFVVDIYDLTTLWRHRQDNHLDAVIQVVYLLYNQSFVRYTEDQLNLISSIIILSKVDRFKVQFVIFKTSKADSTLKSILFR